MSDTLGRRMARLMDDHFAGREFEQQYFKTLLSRLADRTERILYLHGTAGIGKTYLLKRYARLSAELGAYAAYADVREALGSREALGGLLLEALGGGGDGRPGEEAAMRAIHALNDKAREGKVVLLLDGYEEIGSADHWLRERLFPQLSANVLIVVAGRYPLSGPWRSSPAWGKLMAGLPLREFAYEEVADYLREWGVTDEGRIDELWLRTLGHPLSLSLSLSGIDAPARPEGDAPSWEPPEECVRRWLGEAPDEELRGLLYASSVPRCFHQELLSELAGREIGSAEFERLIGLSFVNRSAKGWHLTEIVGETLRAAFKARMPSKFEEYARRAIRHYERRIEEAARMRRAGNWEIAQLMRFSSSPVLRAHLRHSREAGHYFEPVRASNRGEAEAYVRERHRTAKPMRIRCSDAESDAVFRFGMTAEESLLRLSVLPLDDLLATGSDSVKLLRSKEGKAVGLFAVVPIHEGTLAFLSAAPLSRSYFRMLDPKDLLALEVPASRPAGWFVYGIDVADLEDESLRGAIVRALFERIVEGGLVLQSPPPLAYYLHACEGLGFERSEASIHVAYGEDYPAFVYEVDTRREDLNAYLRKMIPELREPDGAPVSATESRAVSGGIGVPGFAGLTAREREVASLLAKGLSNADISSSLYVSEAAVKKHVNAMLSKYGLKNRTQLARAFIEGKSPYET